MTHDLDPRTLRELVDLLSRDVRLLATQTAALARAELRLTKRTLTWSIAGMAIGAAVAVAGLLVLVSALVLIAVALGLPPWAASLVVGVLLAGAGALTVRASVAKLQRGPVTLEATRHSLTETFSWLKAQSSR